MVQCQSEQPGAHPLIIDMIDDRARAKPSGGFPISRQLPQLTILIRLKRLAIAHLHINPNRLNPIPSRQRQHRI